MVESFASSEDLGIIALTLRAGGEIWLAAASIYAVEKDPKEGFTMVKTMGEAIAVLESPQVIFDTIEAVQRDAQRRADRRAVEEFIDFVTENEIDVSGVRDSPITLLESDERMKEIRRRDLAVNEKLTKEESEKLEKEREAAFKREQLLETMKRLGLDGDDVKAILSAQAPVEVPDVMGTPTEVDYDKMTDEKFEQSLREIGVDDAAIESALEHRRSSRFDASAEQEFGDDLGSALRRMREREEGDRGPDEDEAL